MLDFRTFLNNQKYRNFLVLAVIALAIPLTVIIALKQQEIRGRAAAAPDQLEAEGGVLGGNATVITDTNASGGKSVRFSQTNPTQSPSPTPTPITTTKKVVTVSSIVALKTALADNTVDEIVVANGTYHVSCAGCQASDSLWIGAVYASRTRPILVRAQTTGGVTFDGGGTVAFGGITFVDGAHHQTWDGFRWANAKSSAGVIFFGGQLGLPAPHHITLHNITVPASVTSTSVGSLNHAVYFSYSAGGVHDILIDGLTADGAGGLDSAIQFYHSDVGNPNAWNVTIRNVQAVNFDQAFIVWDTTVQNIVIEDSTATNALRYAIRYEAGGTLTLRRVTSTGSGLQGFYSSLGPNPPGVTFINTSLK